MFVGNKETKILSYECLWLHCQCFKLLCNCLYALSIGNIQTIVNRCTGQGLANWASKEDAVKIYWICFLLCLLFAEKIKPLLSKSVSFGGEGLFFPSRDLLKDFLQFIAKVLCVER